MSRGYYFTSPTVFKNNCTPGVKKILYMHKQTKKTLPLPQCFDLTYYTFCRRLVRPPLETIQLNWYRINRVQIISLLSHQQIRLLGCTQEVFIFLQREYFHGCYNSLEFHKCYHYIWMKIIDRRIFSWVWSICLIFRKNAICWESFFGQSGFSCFPESIMHCITWHFLKIAIAFSRFVGYKYFAICKKQLRCFACTL